MRAPKQLLRTAAVLLVALFFWRLVGVETDLVTLRAGVAKTHAALPGSVRPENLPLAPVGEAPRENVPSAGASDSASANPTGYERAVEELQRAKDRIVELEATVKELSEAWNQFAAEEEAKQGLQEARRELARRYQAIQQMEEGHVRNESTKAWEGQMKQLNRVLLERGK